MTTESRYIWVFPVSATRWLWKPLMRYLGETGLRGLMVVQTSQDRKFYLEQFGQEIGL